MVLVVDPWSWLEKDGGFPTSNPRLRRRIIRVARFIEYGGSLQAGESRETLVECKRRPGGRACLGLMWVTKTETDAIEAFCAVCSSAEAVIHNWQETEWASGMMEPVAPDPLRPPAGRIAAGWTAPAELRRPSAIPIRPARRVSGTNKTPGSLTEPGVFTGSGGRI